MPQHCHTAEGPFEMSDFIRKHTIRNSLPFHSLNSLHSLSSFSLFISCFFPSSTSLGKQLSTPPAQPLPPVTAAGLHRQPPPGRFPSSWSLPPSSLQLWRPWCWQELRILPRQRWRQRKGSGHGSRRLYTLVHGLQPALGFGDIFLQPATQVKQPEMPCSGLSSSIGKMGRGCENPGATLPCPTAPSLGEELPVLGGRPQNSPLPSH